MMNNSGASTNSSTPFIKEISVLGINILVGVPIQSYVIWLIVTGTGSGIALEFFLLNLSVCEIINCLDCLLFILSEWVLGAMVLALFFQGLITTGRPLFQCVICVERYLAVVHPVTFLKFKPLRYKVMCCIAVWLLCLGSSVFSFLSLISVNISANSGFSSVFFLFLLSVQLFCGLAVLRALKQSGPGERGREREEENHMKRRAFYLILITTVNMIIMFVPMSISGFFTVATQRYITEFWIPSLVFYVLGGFLQPILYLHRCGKLFCFALS